MDPSESITYKARKEAFVSNLSGSSLTDINLVALVSSSAVLLWTALQKRSSFFTPYTPTSLVADFLLNVCAILFAVTLYSSTPIVLSIFLVTPAVLVSCLTTPSPLDPSSTTGSSRSKKPKTATDDDHKNVKAGAKADNDDDDDGPQPPIGNVDHLPVRPLLTHYRGSMMVVTCLSILAVDFPIFPRRFAKVETWGTSLMDLGVGLFVFSAGVVSARSAVKTSSGASASFASRFSTSLRHASPLFVLGVVRLLSVKNLDYAEHVTEYGVHWNFFFTLCLLPPFVEIFDTLFVNRHQRVPPYRYDVLAVTVSVVYEVILDSHPTLLRYLLISERGPTWLSKNREGVFSFVGYLAIFLSGRGTGRQVVTFNLSRSNDTNTKTNTKTKRKSNIDTNDNYTRRERLVLLRKLFFRTVIYSGLFVFTTDHHWYGGNLTVSRRLANLPYCLWVAAFNNAQLLLFGVVEHSGPEFSYDNTDSKQKAATTDNTSRILSAFNNNGLVIFLVANLLTGLVNLTLNTLDMAPLSAMAILVSYAAVVTSVALGLDYANIKIKI